MNKYLLIFLVSPVSFFAMEQPSEQRKQLIARIVKKEISFEKAEPLINAHCNGDLALKAYARVYLEKTEQLEDYLSWVNERREYLATLKEQAHNDAMVNDVIEVMHEAVNDYCKRMKEYDPYAFAHKLKKENGVLFLKSLGLRPTRTSLNVAIFASDYKFTKLLIEARAEYTNPKDPQHDMQHHPLYNAALENNEQIVALLIKEGGVDLTEKYSGYGSVQRTIIDEVQERLERWSNADQSFEEHRKRKSQAQKALEILKKYS